MGRSTCQMIAFGGVFIIEYLNEYQRYKDAAKDSVNCDQITKLSALQLKEKTTDNDKQSLYLGHSSIYYSTVQSVLVVVVTKQLIIHHAIRRMLSSPRLLRKNY